MSVSLKWPSSEHAYMAISRFKICDWHRFSIGGDLSTLENGFFLIFGGDQIKAKSKADWWGKKKYGWNYCKNGK